MPEREICQMLLGMATRTDNLPTFCHRAPENDLPGIASAKDDQRMLLP